MITSPTILYTDSYASGPISYTADDRFIPPSVTAVLESTNVAGRDAASFVEINGADRTPQRISVLMITPVWERSRYDIVINNDRKSFQFFV